MSARSRKQKHADTEKVDSTPKSVSIDLSSVSSRRSFSRNERSQSPLSISRSEEKDELAHLNDRLAGYIDYVRKLELDKQRLTKRIQSITEERVVSFVYEFYIFFRQALRMLGRRMKMKFRL